MHVRQKIRNKFTALLKEIPAFNNNVYESRVHQLVSDDMPAALVYSESETIEPATKGNRPAIQKRFVETAVYAFAKAEDKVENSLDALTEMIESKICSDPTLGGLVFQTSLLNTVLQIDSEPNSPIGAARMSFMSIVHTQSGNAASTIGGL